MTDPNQPTPAKKGGLFSVLKKVLLVLVLIIVVFAGFVATLPDDFQIVRSTTIDAPAERVFPHVNDFHKWEDWSPWAKRDPAAKNKFEGPADGKGSIFSWDGNNEVGAGRMTILESQSPELVNINLEFFRPMEDKCLTEFTFKPDGGKTLVTWKMSGRHNFIGKAVCFFMNMDKMVGGDFEKGLASMKKIAEAAAP